VRGLGHAPGNYDPAVTRNDRQPPEPGEPAEGQPDQVETRVASGTVRFRQGSDRATASLRVGKVLLIALLLATAAYIAWSPAGAGDVSERVHPSTTPHASIDLATSSLPAESLEPTPATDGATQPLS
jgi:hypothetical protein